MREWIVAALNDDRAFEVVRTGDDTFEIAVCSRRLTPAEMRARLGAF